VGRKDGDKGYMQGGATTNQVSWFSPNPMWVCHSGQFLSVDLFRQKGNLVLDAILSGPRKFVDQRCMRYHKIVLFQLTVEVGAQPQTIDCN